MQYQGKCEYIYQMKPQRFDEAKASDGTLSLTNNGTLLSFGRINVNSNVYACLTYERRMFITFITDGRDSDIVHLIFKNSEEYSNTLSLIKDNLKLKVSPQDGKLVSYARSISDKLRDGIQINIFDAQNDEDFVTCPSCGAKNKYDPSMPYCMDCGESL